MVSINQYSKAIEMKFLARLAVFTIFEAPIDYRMYRKNSVVNEFEEFRFVSGEIELEKTPAFGISR